MARWPIEESHIDDLRLDPRNVRIPEGGYDESAIANYMVEAEDLLELARDILRDGYVDNELPVVTDDGGVWVVLEGNRRATALKAIHNPSLLGRAEPRMERLISRFPEHETPTVIRVMISPSREAAQPLLARLHTRNPKKSWQREQQAIFYHAQISRDVDVDQLRAMYPGEASSIVSFIRMGEMRDLIRGLRFNKPELEHFVRASQLKMTSFEYAYELPGVQAALGLEFDRNGLLRKKRLTAGQRRGLIYLLERFYGSIEPVLNTRSPELKTKGSRPLVEELTRIVGGGPAAGHDTGTGTPGAGSANPGDSSTTNPTGASNTNGTGQGSAGASTNRGSGNAAEGGGAAAGTGGDQGSPGTKPQSRGPNRGATRNRLDMAGFEYKGTSSGLRRRFEELQRIVVVDFPNSTHDLIRTVLECAIKDYYTSKGQSMKGKMLQACITELAKTYQSDQRMTTLINNINRSGKMPASQFAGTTTSLNAANHEPDTFVNGVDVHDAWEKIKPILIEIVGK